MNARPLLFFFALMFSSATQAALPFAVGDNALPSLAPMVKQASPAVVNIAVKGTVAAQRNNPFMNDPFFRDFFRGQPRQQRPTQSAGSGVIVDAANGYIMTNHHVIENADEITITLFDDRELSATIVGSDADSDVAVIQVDARKLAQIPYANSDDLEVGDFVVAIGNPFGFSHTVTSGIVSGLGRYGLSTSNGVENFIQTDAAINPGNSGGALLNLRGELIGINTAIVSRSGGNVGIGFAIPINMARNIMEQILEFGEVRRGLLGVTIGIVDDALVDVLDLETDYGAIVRTIQPGSAAEKAGLQVEDVIVSVDGKAVKNPLELRNAIGLQREGKQVEIGYYRDGKLQKVAAVLGSENRLQAASVDGAPSDTLHPGLRGATFANLADSRSTSDADGVLVTEVDPNSPAARYGLESGDIVTRVNRKRVSSLDEFRERAASDAPILILNVLRGSSVRMLRIG
ncbi:MAG: DegQ family serine endoprotease [Pseudomonadota bacterium]